MYTNLIYGPDFTEMKLKNNAQNIRVNLNLLQVHTRCKHVAHKLVGATLIHAQQLTER